MCDDFLAMGLDLSTNHAAAVILDDEGDGVWCGLVVKEKKYMDIMGDGATERVPPRKKDESKENYEARRLWWMAKVLRSWMMKMDWMGLDHPNYINMEDYAYGAGSASMTILAQVAGVAKEIFYNANIPYRLTDPTSVKLFATGRGDADKCAMVAAARERIEIPDGLLAKHDMEGPGTDIADSFWLAEILRVELLVRRGIIDLKDLTDGQRRVFLRTTKAHPVNLLDTPFVEREE